jgi:hypothetical protein
VAPYKVTTSKGKLERVKEWYGEWQTSPWRRPIIEADGTIPRNSFGNIEVFHDLMIPIGCVLLNDNRLSMIAKKLGIDVAKVFCIITHERLLSTSSISKVVPIRLFKALSVK